MPKSNKSAKRTTSQVMALVRAHEVTSADFNPSKRAITVKLVGGKTATVHYASDQAQLQFQELLQKYNVKFDSKGTGGFSWASLLVFVLAVRAADRVLDLPDEPDAGRRVEGDELRQVAREADGAGFAEDRVQGRRGRGRGGRGAAGDQGVPREPEEVPGARRAHPEGCAAVRAAGYRQDAAGARGRGRGGRAVLLDLGLRLRRDVRRCRRLACARPVRAGEAGLAVHRLHGRDRRGRPASRRGHRRRARRARADAEPAARRDGRLRDEGQHHPDRRHEPSRHPRSGAAASGSLRPPDRRRSPRPERPAEDPRGAFEGQAARARDRPRRSRGGHAGLHGRRSREPRQRGRAARGAPRQEGDRAGGARGGDHAGDRRPREEGAPALREGAADHGVPRDGARRWSATSSRTPIRCTRSPSSRAARRSV